MVVVSGYNISVLINTLARVLVFIPLKLRFALTVLFITFFVLLVGPEAPVVRAAIMGTIALLGTVLGRQNDAIRALLASAMLMVIVNPEWATELSFQLSFLATLGLIVVFPLLDRLVPGKSVPSGGSVDNTGGSGDGLATHCLCFWAGFTSLPGGKYPCSMDNTYNYLFGPDYNHNGVTYQGCNYSDNGSSTTFSRLFYLDCRVVLLLECWML